jgi:hypothetical protein
MRPGAKPYHIADISYNSSWPDMPWYIQRAGVVAEQGGLAFGYETVSFKTLSDAMIYLEETIERDLDTIKEKIEEIE